MKFDWPFALGVAMLVMSGVVLRDMFPDPLTGHQVLGILIGVLAAVNAGAMFLYSYLFDRLRELTEQKEILLDHIDGMDKEIEDLKNGN